MSNRNIAEEARNIVKFVNELGGITDAQIDKLLGKKKKHKEYYVSSIKNQYIKPLSNGQYASATQQMLYSSQMELCAWVLLENFYNSDGSMVSYYKIKYPGQISFLKDGTLNSLAMITKNDGGTLALLEQNYLENFSDINNSIESKQPSFRYLFVITNLDVMYMISEAGLSAPFSIVYIKNFNENGPVLEYYG